MWGAGDPTEYVRPTPHLRADRAMDEVQKPSNPEGQN
jgi:hypothetical protein